MLHYLQQLSEIQVLGFLVVALGAPVDDRFAVVDDDLEECVHQQNTVRLHHIGVDLIISLHSFVWELDQRGEGGLIGYCKSRSIFWSRYALLQWFPTRSGP